MEETKTTHISDDGSVLPPKSESGEGARPQKQETNQQVEVESVDRAKHSESEEQMQFRREVMHEMKRFQLIENLLRDMRLQTEDGESQREGHQVWVCRTLMLRKHLREPDFSSDAGRNTVWDTKGPSWSAMNGGESAEAATPQCRSHQPFGAAI